MRECVMSEMLYRYSTGRRTVLYGLSLCLLSHVLSAPFSDQQAESPQHAVTVLPSRTDQQGRHTSYDLLTKLPSDAASSGSHSSQYYRLEIPGRVLRLNVSTGTEFVSSGHTVEYHSRGDGVRTSEKGVSDCHYLTGSAREETAEGELLQEGGWAAISNCGGLRGVISTDSGYWYIEPLRAILDHPHTQPQHHILYTQQPTKTTTACAYEKTKSYEDGDTSSQGEVRVQRSADLTSTVSEHYVEVAVVADRTMLEYHGPHELEAYIFTLMNMVAHIYRHPSIGHAMNIVLVRTVILETDQDGLSVTSNALGSLSSFCSWQSSSPLMTGAHRDATVLLTRKNICEGFGTVCDTLGIAEFRGACNQEKSCSITEDIGLATAFTIAHELGHNLGIRHDGDMSADCYPDRHFIMAPSFAQSHNPHIWSHCSRQQLAEFLLSPENTCLFNQPVVAEDDSSALPPSPLPLPGMETTPTEQCRLRFGEQASHCSPNTTTLPMVSGKRPIRLQPPSHPSCPGTECTISSSGKGGVCYEGSCVEFSSLVDPVEGGWGQWGEWEECSLSCGTGVQSSSRFCDSPVPANGGRYCLGPNHRSQTCNNFPCPSHNDIRQELCERDPPHHRFTQWQAPSLEYILGQGLDQCSHHCLAKPHGILFTVTLGLPDGTPCLFSPSPSPSHSLQLSMVPESLGVCVSGECVPVGCDDALHSMASRDTCGVWCGNGSSCISVSDTYTISKDSSNTSDYVYHRTVTLPRGSAQVKISELQPTQNLYLAATTPTENFNGNYRVKDRELKSYWFAGVNWWYERPDDGIEVLWTSGVLKDDVTIFIIANTENVSIHYSAGVPPNNATIFTVSHVWETGEWGECEGMCGEGVRRRRVECVRDDAVFNDSYCDSETRPLSRETCSTERECVYEWHVSSWSECNTTCGEGEREREIHCLLTNNNTATSSDYCSNETKPRDTMHCYSERDCVFEWQTGDWNSCSSACGEGQRERNVSCTLTNNQTEVSSSRCVGNGPDSLQSCHSERGCVYRWRGGAWGNCSSACGEGEREREVTCVLLNNGSAVSSSHCANVTAPNNKTHCYREEGCKFEWTIGEWGSCSEDCGAGTRTRGVTCQLVNNATSVDDSLCNSTARPSSEDQCYREDGCVFEWKTTSVWGACSEGCGGGVRTRNVVCVLRRNGTVMERRYCDESVRPDSMSQCYSEDECVYRWWYGNWTSCSMNCGHGTRSREIACYLTNNDTRVDSSHCSSDTPPDDVTGCYDETGCVFGWGSGPWNECNATCDTGQRTRRVSCILTTNVTIVADTHCPAAAKPSEIRHCYSGRGCVFVWESGEWGDCGALCGGGERRRDVRCHLTNNNTDVDRAHCEGPEPVGVASCGVEECRFEWRVGEWGVCVGDSCEGGRRWREVECILVNNRSVVDESHCSSEAERPETSSECQVEVCQYEWVVGEWGRCDAVCGEGVKEREVYCELVNGKGGRRRVERERCSESVKPQNSDTCSEEPCSNFVWTAGDWGKCDAECDEYGTQTRTVTCQRENGTEGPYCTTPGHNKPPSVKRCEGDPCPAPCVDAPFTSCGLVVRIRLCHLQYLHNLCCHSCSRA